MLTRYAPYLAGVDLSGSGTVWITGFGTAFRSVSQFFGDGGGKGRSRDNSSMIVVILLVALALAAGVLTTTFIIWKVAATTPMPRRSTHTHPY